jgi:uncharacterized membrane-anchored protein
LRARHTPPARNRCQDQDLRDHPLRQALTNEVHARPPVTLAAPARASMLAMLSGEGGAALDREQLNRLCAWSGAPRPPPDATHFHVFMGSFQLRWERHTEFSTWTIYRPGSFTDAFAEPALAALPPDWVAALPGELLVGIHLAIQDRAHPLPTPGQLTAIFGSDKYVGAAMAGGAATAWTDFRIHGDDFGRILVHDHACTPGQIGRLTQRLFEIETYRMLALLALPLARAVLPRLAGIETELADLTTEFADLQTLEAEGHALDRLTALAARTERIVSETSYRFSAADAYHALVERRIEELREVRIEGLQTVGEFMQRRLLPAIETCDAVGRRGDILSQRVGRANSLLRTRVEVALERVNADLLRSMDRRAGLQLRLQQTVEGLSVAAISYFAIGITSHVLSALHANGVRVDAEQAEIVAIPLVLGAVLFNWWRIRRHLKH